MAYFDRHTNEPLNAVTCMLTNFALFVLRNLLLELKIVSLAAAIEALKNKEIESFLSEFTEIIAEKEGEKVKSYL